MVCISTYFKKIMNKTRSILQYVSDLHLEKGYKRQIKPSKPLLVLCGDIGHPNEISYKNFLLEISFSFDKVFVVSGNHEFSDKSLSFDDTELLIKNVCEMRNNLFYLQKNKHLIDEKENIYIAGCTLFAEFPLSKQHIHKDHSRWLNDLVINDQKSKYVIASHHCPHINLLAGGNYKFFNPKYFASDQTKVFERDNVFMWIFGHSHHNIDVMMNNTLFTTNQYGKFEYPLSRYKK